MNLYYPDQVEITPVSRDINFRTEVEGTPFLFKAYVEDESEIKYGSDGQPLDPVMFVGLPVNTLITKGDYIKITKLHGVIKTNSERRKVKKVIEIGSFGMSHIEAYV